MKKNIVAVLAIVLSFAMPFPAHADTGAVASDLQKMMNNMAKEMEKMKQLIEQQNAKIQILERRSTDGVQVPVKAEPAKPAKMSEEDFKKMLEKEVKNVKYFKNLKMGGDYRLRYEAFDEQENTSTNETRNRFRHRLRYGIENGVGDDMTVGFRIVTAGLNSTNPTSTTNAAGTVYAGDPTSTNQTFGSPGLFSYHTIALDQAYAKYAPSILKDRDLGLIKIKKAEIGGGKFSNPFLKYSSPMVWDGDVMPEGAYEQIQLGLIEGESGKLTLTGTAMQTLLVESGSGGRDSNMFGFGAALNAEGYTPLFDKPVDFTTALNSYHYQNYANRNNHILVSSNLARGNTTCVGTANAGPCTGLEAGDPRILQFYNELKISPMSTPIKLFSDIATNINNGSVSGASARKNTGWGLGASIGELKEPKDWQVSYGYYQIPPNAVVGAFSDSDFGHGYANQRGSVVKAGYQLTKALQLNLSWFHVGAYDSNISSQRDQTTNRFQTDLSWKF